MIIFKLHKPTWTNFSHQTTKKIRLNLQKSRVPCFVRTFCNSPFQYSNPNQIHRNLILRSSTLNHEHVGTKRIKFGPVITREIGFDSCQTFCPAFCPSEACSWSCGFKSQPNLLKIDLVVPLTYTKLFQLVSHDLIQCTSSNQQINFSFSRKFCIKFISFKLMIF